MSMKDFIRRNREGIDFHIREARKEKGYPLNDRDREEWILNDTSLYYWARSEGVRV